MPKSYQMTYVPASKRWMKVYRGKSYAVSCRQLNCPPSKDASWMAANLWWEAKQKEIDASHQPDPTTVAATKIGGVLDHLDVKALRELVDRANAAKVLLASLEDRQERGKVGPSVVNFEMEHGMISRALNKLTPDASPDRTVAAQVTKWLDMLTAGGLKEATVRYYRYSAGRFTTWIGNQADVSTITAPKVEEFFGHLSVQVAEQKLAPATAAETMKVARQFVGRLAELGLIPLPGNLNSRRLKFTVTPTAFKTFSDDEVRAVLSASVGRLEKTKVYLLLMLNCGMYQSDLSELRNDEVDWKAGTITRERTKRKGRAGAMTVTYTLWPETLAELKKHRQPGDLVLRTSNGKKLVDRWNEAGRMRSYDCVKSAWRAVARDAGVTKPLKVFRKTSASKLAQHPAYKFYASYFLAHSPKTLAERHYVKPSEDEFKEALAWLRSQWIKD